ncbi:MAG TPA: hypothetical protein V6C89_09525 [Drouetiella sp.]|jgi:hypothetical protein
MFQHRDKTNQLTYRLGRIVFSIANFDAQVEQEFQNCLQACDKDDSVQAEHVYDGKKDNINDIVDVINDVHKRHTNTLWILAAALVSPAGHKVLLAAPSHAGKSTTAMGLVLGYDWKVLSEDITHIDLITDEIINFASPFAVKPGTPERLKEAVQAEFSTVKAPSVEPSSWLPLKDHSLGHNLKAPFDLAFYLDPFDGGDYRCSPISTSEYIRTLLPLSNVARQREAAAKVSQYVQENRCFRVSEGNLQQRLQSITQLESNIGEESVHHGV